MTSTKTKIFKFVWGNFIKPISSNPNIVKKNNKWLKNRPIKDNNVEAKKVIYYMHGGVYLYGLNNIYKNFGCVLCDLREDIEVILLDYSLAPEHIYPTQLNEALDVWMELTKTFDPKNIIVGGDSAGAPGAGIFFSPWTDMTCTSESFYRNYTKDIIVGGTKGPLTKEKVEEMKNSITYSFIGNAERTDPYISPIFADYSTFPKSIFFVGDEEMLLDDTVTVVKKIRENPDNQVELIVKEGMFHVYPLIGSFSFLSINPNNYTIPEGKEAIERVKQFILDYYQ
ncbi:hypothetical protein PIROE2DRAFT_14536 [Piromyces sp. E2]|nr:hypothetical protein PIROE2DRAFT_14536 [Piromyces sp. E2]|eukprot:OUM59835.1 hypothetical protein PIROE2DRAFT_14536 [Piromyces sp. E2]